MDWSEGTGVDGFLDLWMEFRERSLWLDGRGEKGILLEEQQQALSDLPLSYINQCQAKDDTKEQREGFKKIVSASATPSILSLPRTEQTQSLLIV